VSSEEIVEIGAVEFDAAAAMVEASPMSMKLRVLLKNSSFPLFASLFF